MKIKPLVSVILPTHNRAHLLPRSINSVLNQTYRNLELIIIDDASKDETKLLLENLIQKDDRIKYIKNKHNLGAPLSRNKGIKLAKGRYIAFQDSDDEWLPTKIEKQINVFMSNKDVDAVYCGITYCKENDKLNNFCPNYCGKKLLELMLCKEIIPGTPSIIVKKTLLENINGFLNVKSNQDYLLYINLAQKKANFSYVDECLVNVYEQKQGISNNISNKIKGRKSVIKFIKDNNNIDKSLKNISLSSQYFRLAIFYLLDSNYKELEKNLLKSYSYKRNPKALLFLIIFKFNSKLLKKTYIKLRRLTNDPIFYS